MAKNEKNTLRDGWTSTLGGVDSSRAPNLLSPDQHAFVVNGTLRGGYTESRPPFVSHTLVFSSDEQEQWWQDNILQAAKAYYPPKHDTEIVASVGGRIFRIGIPSYEVREITPQRVTTITSATISPPQGSSLTITVLSSDGMEVNFPVMIGDGQYTVTNINNTSVTVQNDSATAGVAIPLNATVSFPDRNPTDLPLAWMEQAEEFLIIQNGIDRAIIYDGASARRANILEAQEVPTGTVMIYNEEIGRLCVCVNGNEIAIGNVVGGPTSILVFDETTYLNEGGKFRIPRKFGNVTGAAMMTNLDRSNGQGAMLFFAERGISAFNLPPTRELWKELNYPAQVNMPIRYGAVSHDSIVNVNGDVFYRSKDGIRSFIMAVREFGKWGNVPMSREMDRVLAEDDERLLRFSSVALFDNRLLFTCSPRPNHKSAFHGGMVVLDFDLISSMGEQSRPVWDGIWTGISPVKFVTGEFQGEERCFIFCHGTEGGVQLRELLRSGNFDGDDGRIQWSIESRAMDYRGQDELKRLSDFELWLDRVAGEVDIELLYKPDQYPCWTTWGSRDVCQTVKDCGAEVCGLPADYKVGYRTRLGFGTPPQVDDNVDMKPMALGYTHQFRLNITGRARVKMAIAKAEVVPEWRYAETT